MIDENPSFTPINNPKRVNSLQRKILEELIDKRIIEGKKEGIDYLTKKEVDKIIIDARAKYGNDSSRISE